MGKNQQGVVLHTAAAHHIYPPSPSTLEVVVKLPADHQFCETLQTRSPSGTGCHSQVHDVFDLQQAVLAASRRPNAPSPLC